MTNASCAGAEMLAAIERKGVSRKNLQMVVVRHAEDISWSDPFAAVRTVYEKPGEELPTLPLTLPSAGEGASAPGAATVVIPNVGKEQHAYLTHIVRNFDSLADWSIFLHGKMSTCGFFLADQNLMGNHLLTNVSVLDYLLAEGCIHSGLVGGVYPCQVYMPLTGRASRDLKRSSFRSTFADGLAPRPRVSRPVTTYPIHGDTESDTDAGGGDRWLEWEVNDLPALAKELTLKQGVLPVEAMLDFDTFFRRVIGRAPPAVLYFAQGAQFAASRAALRSTPKETYQWILELVEAGHLEVTFYLEVIWLYVLHGAEDTPEWNTTIVDHVETLPFLDHLASARAVLEANTDSDELVADLIYHTKEQGGPALMAHRGSPGFSILLLAQLDNITQEALLPCSVQEGVDWPLNNLAAQATWDAPSCLARCARHEHCTAYVFVPPRKDSELPGSCFLKTVVDFDSYVINISLVAGTWPCTQKIVAASVFGCL